MLRRAPGFTPRIVLQSQPGSDAPAKFTLAKDSDQLMEILKEKSVYIYLLMVLGRAVNEEFRVFFEGQDSI